MKKDLGRRCSVCDHPKIREITADLISGMGSRVLSCRYPPLSKSALARHATHIKRSLQKLDPETLAKEKREERSEAEKRDMANALIAGLPVLDQMRKLTARLMRILDKAEAREDDITALAAHRELRRGIELLAKLTGELTAPAEIIGTPLTVIVQYVERGLAAPPADAIDVTTVSASLAAPDKVQ